MSEIYERMAVVVKLLGQDKALASAVAEGVDSFFGRHPALERTPWTDRIATVVTFDRLTAAPADSQSAQPQKAA